jgi:DNA-binding response OmpR family regulator
MTESPITVLLIEDNPGDARLIQEILREETSARFTVQHADRLATGLERLAAGGIDVVLLDLSLPDSHGLDTFHQVHARSPQVPIIVLTALDDEAVAIETLQSGGQDYLVKTYLNYAVMHRSIRYSIERQRVIEELERAKEAAEAANRATDQLLAVLGYGRRTPRGSSPGS